MLRQPGITKQITEDNLLLVEGDEEVRFFGALSEYLEVANLQVEPLLGKSSLPDKIGAVKSWSDFGRIRSLAVIRDADDDPKAAFQSVCEALKTTGLPVPKRPCDAALGNPTVRVFILPSNDARGMLEDLCLEAFAGDPAIACVHEYFKCLRGNGVPDPNNMSKARIHAFLASRKNPDLRLGDAAAAKYVPWDAKAFAQIKQFLRDIVA
jgi:hypothetical protein